MKTACYVMVILVAMFSSCADPSAQFVGVWNYIDNNGSNGKITITKLNKNQVLVDYDHKKYAGVSDGRKLYDDNGSFKESGNIVDHTIVIDPSLKLTLLDPNKLLLNGSEFVRSNGSNITIASPDPMPQPAEQQKPALSREEQIKRTQDEIEAAQRMADSLAAMEAYMSH